MKFSEILLQKISYYLRDRNEKISIAESVTSGALQLAFSQMPGAEQFFEGGTTVYTIDQKVKHLNIDYDEANAVNCVSKNITETMAINVAKLFRTEWSIATTGYSTPVPESGNDIFAFYAVSYKGEVVLSDRIELHPLTKPMDAQSYFTECALSSLRCEVKRPFPQTH
ncbi:CinA family protein [Epilithonimonas zeae]|uniref:Amidohydrolase, PncC family n=1 Tax=Epilithonimonas zeae TaxID=1416779 RepID=A0A1N6FUW0_9FLAO|nr:CinA family protein [Epilithonimonas zeae]SIN98997.1 amidohydrolase, PncC family [Epilithonimonas zeae]